MERQSSQLEKLTPVEIKNKEFKRSLWGYSPREVVDFLDQTARSWEEVQRHERELLSKMQDLETSLDTWKERETELDKLRSQAEAQAETTMQEAAKEATRYFEQIQQRAEQIRVKTESWLERVLKEVENTEKKKTAFVESVKTTLDQHYALLDAEESSDELGNSINKLLEDFKEAPSKEPV